jgi:2-polyprenyl-3-methyl-5-hydroxy-6-metoxy-1,4-benzoquinol methylase
METASQPDILRIVREIMARHGARCTPEEFHSAVNITFHDFESEVYDHEHADMWGSVPEQVDLLVRDCAQSDPDDKRPLAVLDIGCGTGLASHSLLQSALAHRVKSIDLLDTSPAMMRQAAKRAEGWNVPYRCHRGYLHELQGGREYDLIITCSVLHHVPDLGAFLRQVRVRQAPAGVFIHLQDPNGDYSDHPELRKRRETSKNVLPQVLKRFTPGRIVRRLYRELTGKQGQDHISKTNRALLQAGLITTPLTTNEIYEITDIHVEDGNGISIERLRAWLPEYECISQRSYGFFGVLRTSLPPELQKTEAQLIESHALNGIHVGAAWRLRAGVPNQDSPGNTTTSPRA